VLNCSGGTIGTSQLNHIKMTYENRILCFFDILGFGDIICNKKLEATEINQLFTDINLITQDYKRDDIQISHFSDSIVISILGTLQTGRQLDFVIEILSKLLEYKLIARGAIVNGELIHTTNNIFGPALVRAVYLEKCIAKYPRIILDESLYDVVLPTIGNSDITYADFFDNFRYIKKDKIDNRHYIDLIGEISRNDDSCRLYEILKMLINAGIEDHIKKMGICDFRRTTFLI
jgi:hypothetical protein